MLNLYGIPNCDTLKKARIWLEEQALDFQFHDYKKVGIEVSTLQAWVKQVGWEVLVNRRGTTWRKLAETDRETLNQASAIGLMQANPSLIKRPVLDTGSQLLVGFDPIEWQQKLINP